MRHLEMSYTAALSALPGVTFGVEDGQVDIDDARAPAINASIVLPVSADLLVAVDPRQTSAPRCVLTATTRDKTDPNFIGTIVYEFDLAVRGRSAPHGDGTVTVELASDEALLDDYRALARNTRPREMRTLRQVIAYVLSLVIPGSVDRLMPGPSPEAVAWDADRDALVWEAGRSALEYLMPLVQAAGMRLVCDEQRRWTLRPETYSLEGDEPTFDIAYGINMIDGTDRLNRDDDLWFDAAVVRYEWIDEGVRREMIDSFALTNPPTRVRVFERSTRYPGRGFAEYAVRRAQVRGREVTVRAITSWGVRPELFGKITLPHTPIQMGNVQRVTFDLASDEMEIAARTIDTPASAYILAPESLRYTDYPPTLAIQDIDWSTL